MASEQLKNHLKNNCFGHRNAVTYQELAQTLHISEKELQRQVNRLRKNQVASLEAALENFGEEQNARGTDR